jgi:hypothetical protein
MVQQLVDQLDLMSRTVATRMRKVEDEVFYMSAAKADIIEEALQHVMMVPCHHSNRTWG